MRHAPSLREERIRWRRLDGTGGLTVKKSKKATAINKKKKVVIIITPQVFHPPLFTSIALSHDARERDATTQQAAIAEATVCGAGPGRIGIRAKASRGARFNVAAAGTGTGPGAEAGVAMGSTRYGGRWTFVSRSPPRGGSTPRVSSVSSSSMSLSSGLRHHHHHHHHHRLSSLSSSRSITVASVSGVNRSNPSSSSSSSSPTLPGTFPSFSSSSSASHEPAKQPKGGGASVGVGEIHVIMGPMFAGKTTELLDRVAEDEARGLRVALVKSCKDNRYSDDEVVSHDGTARRCNAVAELEELRHVIGEEAWAATDVIAVDEAQFIPDLVEWCERVADAEPKKIIVAGLNGDFQRRRFGPVLDLIPLCDSVTKLTGGTCSGCAEAPALFSMRIVANKDDQELVGGADTYRPVCRRCYVEGTKRRAPETGGAGQAGQAGAGGSR